MNKKYLVGIASLVVIGILYYIFNPPAQEVKVYEVKKGKIQQYISETGIVQSSNYMDIYSLEGGIVESLPVKIGSSVKKGDVLVVLKNNDLAVQKSMQESQLNQAKNSFSLLKADVIRAEIEVKQARQNYDRAKKLFKAGAISQNELDTAYHHLNILENTLKEQEESLNTIFKQIKALKKAVQVIEEKEQDLVITSPIEGTIVRLPIKLSQYVMPATPIIQVASTSKLEIKADILSDDMADIRVGQKVRVTAPLLKGDVLEGKVIKIYPQAEEKQSALGVIQRRVTVIISLENADKLRPGYEVKVDIETLSKKDVLIIPRESVIYDDTGKKLVMVINNGRIKYTEIETGIGDKSNIEILSGLKSEQKIVLDASLNLNEGLKVKEVY